MIHIYQKRKTAFIGMDMHKDIHVAVVIDCWMNRIGKIVLENRPGKFDRFIVDIKKICGELTPCFGLEDTRGFGRNLAAYLVGHKYTVKHVNPAYTNAMRLSAPMAQKDDDFDAFCVARVLRDMIDTLPDASHEDIFWTIRQLVRRRDAITKGIVISKNQLHGQLMYVYPSYRKFFDEVDCKTALHFWESYPSPVHLNGVTEEDLLLSLKEANKRISKKKPNEILTLVEVDGDTRKDFQLERDFIVKNIVKELKYRYADLDEIDSELEKLLPLTGYKLETMPGINLITASQLISEIGDINRFPNSDKLARFAGISPVNFSSAGKGKDQRCRQGNRVLNGVFHFLAIQLIQVSPQGKPRHPAFREYYERKLKECKTKPQAIVCVSRRVLRVIYGMMQNKTEYRPYEKVD